MRALFDKTAELISLSDLELSNELKLSFYGLYKHVTAGPCHDEAPSIVALKARAKYQAWLAVKSMTQEEAIRAYVELAASLDTTKDQRFKINLLEFYQANQCAQSVSDSTPLVLSESAPLHQSTTSTVSSSIPPRQHLVGQMLQKRSFTERIFSNFGINPIFPRGQLEISFSDLGFAAAQCVLLETTTSSYLKEEEHISDIWRNNSVHEDVMVGLSVRSLFDLYLRCKAYPAQSEVVVVPPINIPGMMDVLKYHDLKAVGVDLPEYEGINPVIRVDIEGVEAAITGKTVAIMVVHPFGIVSTTDKEMEELRAMADARKIDLIEDCAECFTGLGPDEYRGSKNADICFFSFGTIKTSTALGAGIATLRSQNVFSKMKRKHLYLYQQQRQSIFFFKIVLAVFIKGVASSPLIHGLLFTICQRFFGLDVDKLVYSLTRSFVSKIDGISKEPIIKARSALINQIRSRPCPALLSLLRRRLEEAKVQAPSLKSKTDRYNRIRTIISEDESFKIGVPIPSPESAHTYWLCPVLVRDPAAASRNILHHGFDAPRGLSQLGLIESDSRCPRALQVMESVVYLPISNPQLSGSAMRRLVAAIQESVSSTTYTRPMLSLGPQSLCFRAVVAIGVVCMFLVGYFYRYDFVPTMVCLIFGMAYLAFVTTIVAFATAIVFRLAMADSYVSLSNSFAKHCSLLDECTYEITSDSKGDHVATDTVIETVSSPSDSTSVFITGATGFVGSSLLHNLLRRRKRQGFSGHIVVLCRPKYGKTASQRINDLLEKPIFAFISDDEKALFIKVVEGDVAKPNVGLSDADIRCMSEEWNVGRVFHCAASVSFTHTLEDAAAYNITPSLILQDFTKRLKNLEAKYVHISTAFVHGGKTGTQEQPLPEKLFSLGEHNAMEIYRSMKGTQFYAQSAMQDLDFPNTYTFSKCVCEHLLLSRDKGETIIIRPAIVGPAICEPYEGWAGDKPSTIVAAVCLQMKSQWNIWCMGNERVPYIPVDVTVQFVAAKAFDDQHTRRHEHDTESLTSSDGSFERISADEILSISTIGQTRALSPLLSLMELKDPRIFNAAWDADSSPAVQFTWRELAYSVNQVGSFLGYFSRFTAYVVLAFATKVVPSLKLRRRHSEFLHAIIVRFPIAAVVSILKFLNWEPPCARKLKMLQSFVDLPLLFFPFTSQTFYFRSGIVVPEGITGDRYLVACIAAAHRFLSSQHILKLPDGQSLKHTMKYVSIAGQNCPRETFDLWWALMQPKGNPFIRIAGFFTVKLLRAICTDVTVDVSSFSALQQQLKSDNKQKYIILAPTHRSVFDFLLVSFIAFALPELNIKIPFIVAAAEFANLPIIGWFARRANAFFVRRGRGYDPSLAKVVHRLKRENEYIEVFIEGTRSRDRRFERPKTGFLRCLVETGGNHLIVPININYEKVPEQAAFASETSGRGGSRLSTDGLFTWLSQAFSGKFCIGRIHVSASDPIGLDGGGDNEKAVDIRGLANQIQKAQKQCILVSDYHISAAAHILKIDKSVVSRAVYALGCTQWPESNNLKCLHLSPTETDCSTQLWSVMLHFGHLLAPAICASRPEWGTWLDPCTKVEASTSSDMNDVDIASLAKALISVFDRADNIATRAIDQLREKGFSTPKANHVLQWAIRYVGHNSGLPHPVLLRAIQTRIDSDSEQVSDEPTVFGQLASLGPVDDRKIGGHQDIGKWGYADCRFVLQVDGNGATGVVMKGSRYSLCGRSLKKLIPFIENETKCRFSPYNERALDVVNMECPPSDLSECHLEQLNASVSRCSTENMDRLHHATGQAQEDVYMLRSGCISGLRLPDVVVWPSSEGQVRILLSLSQKYGWCLLPFGGGTNVSHATRCPTKEREPRPIISVDMKLMNQIIWINEEDGLAHVQAGITGSDLVEEMRKRGYCIGHEPDSLEFSTLGGWIATKASGMKRGKYGNIEDIVMEVKVVGSGGLLATDHKTVGRSAIGLELVSIILGSEGCLGIITSATIRIWPLPVCTDFDSVVFPDFGQGILFARDVAKLGPLAPASVRVLDNDHFRLGQALHVEETLLQKVVVQIAKKLLPSFQMASKEAAVCATIVFEGSKEEVHDQKKRIRGLVMKHGGVQVGPRIGRAGYELTFSIAYLRDFALTYNFLGDSFETFAPWSKLERIVAQTKERIRKDHLERCLPGAPFIACRITQMYHEGACVYFYVCMNIDQVKSPSNVFTSIEHAAREEILKQGGSLSHHHGVGKIRAPFLHDLYSETYRATLASVKNCIDPENVFGARNGVFS